MRKINSGHITDVKLASYIDKKLKKKEIEEVVIHLIECQECRYTLIQTTIDIEEEKSNYKKTKFSKFSKYYLKFIPLALVASILIMVIIPINEKSASYLNTKEIDLKQNNWIEQFLKDIEKQLKKFIRGTK